MIQNSNALLESYGIKDAETFLSAIDSEITTVNFDAEGEKSVVIVGVKDAEKLKKSIAGIDFKKQPEKHQKSEIWISEDANSAAIFIENLLFLGEVQSVVKCLEVKGNGENFTKNPSFKFFNESKTVAVTSGSETDSAEKIVEVLAELKDEKPRITTHFLTETRFTEKGFERKTVSDFGLLGDIIERFNE